MMSLTPKQAQVMRFLQASIDATGICPTYVEIAEAVDLISKSGVHRLLVALEERGAISRIPGRDRCIKILQRVPYAGSSYEAAYEAGRRDGYQDGVGCGYSAGIAWALEKAGLPSDHLDKFMNEISNR